MKRHTSMPSWNRDPALRTLDLRKWAMDQHGRKVFVVRTKAVARGWELMAEMLPEIKYVATELEQCCKNELTGLQDLKGKEMRSLDSAHMDTEESGFTIQIRSQFLESEAFRKIHFEIAKTSTNLRILHCVMYPRYTYDLPILGIDMIGARDVTFAIADLFPVTLEQRHNSKLLQMAKDSRGPLKTNRNIPSWAEEIVSSEYLCLAPGAAQERWAFAHYCIALAKIYFQMAEMTNSDGNLVSSIRAGHIKFCENNLQNDKTRRVLEKAFGGNLAYTYMTETMFDAS